MVTIDKNWVSDETHFFIHSSRQLLSGNSDSVGHHQKEMPSRVDFIHVEIPGLCIGGGDVGVDVGSSQQVRSIFVL